MAACMTCEVTVLPMDLLYFLSLYPFQIHSVLSSCMSFCFLFCVFQIFPDFVSVGLILRKVQYLVSAALRPHTLSDIEGCNNELLFHYLWCIALTLLLFMKPFSPQIFNYVSKYLPTFPNTCLHFRDTCLHKQRIPMSGKISTPTPRSFPKVHPQILYIIFICANACSFEFYVI